MSKAVWKKSGSPPSPHMLKKRAGYLRAQTAKAREAYVARGPKAEPEPDEIIMLEHVIEESKTCA